MGCFPCAGDGDTSVKKPDKKIFQNGSHHKYKRVDQPKSKQVDLPVASQFKVVKHEEAKLTNRSTSKKDGVYSNIPPADGKTVDKPVSGQFKVVKHEEAKIANRSTSKKDGIYSNISPADGKTGDAKAQRFKFDQLIAATENFKEEHFLGEGGFGKVYKGHLEDTGEIVAIKQLDPNGCQGVREFVVEVQTLSKADHPNLVKLIGCCAEGDQRLLVYEYMSLGSLEDHLFDPWPNQKTLDWNIRMKIAAGAARGLEYLHDKMTPPIIYRDLKCSNILLGDGFHPKLSDFGLAKVGPSGDKTHVSTRVMGTYGYCAPDYAMTGQLTFKSDIYSFGVVLLEIITGRRAIDYTKSTAEQNLVSWARPLFKDRKKFYKMADPALDGHYPIRSLYQALAIAAMCVQEQPNMRPPIVDIVTALNYLASLKYDPEIEPPIRKSYKSHSSQKSKNDEETW